MKKILAVLAMVMSSVVAMAQAYPGIPPLYAGYTSTGGTGLSGSWNPMAGSGGMTPYPAGVPQAIGLYYSSDGTGHAGTWLPWTGSGGGGGSCGSNFIPCTNTTNTFTAPQTINGGASNDVLLITSSSAVGTDLHLKGTDASVDDWLILSAGSGVVSHKLFVGDLTTGVYVLGISSLAGGAASLEVPTLSVYCWAPTNSITTAACDTGLSRDSAGVVDVGNGAQGNSSGTLKLGNILSAASTIGLGNVTYYPAACGSLSTAPSWCAGSDMGAWINAAYAAGTSPVNISIDPGTYSYSTPIALSTNGKLVTIEWNNAILTYTPSTGTAMTITTGGGVAAFSAIYNMQLRTAASGATSTGVAIGDGVTNADYTRLADPYISGFKTLVSAASYGLEIDNPNLQPCSSAAGSIAVSQTGSGDDIKIIGGTLGTCATAFSNTTVNKFTLTTTVLEGATTNAIVNTGGGSGLCLGCHYLNHAAATAHFANNSGILINTGCYIEDDATSGNTSGPFTNTGMISIGGCSMQSNGATYTNLLSGAPSSWSGSFATFPQDYGGHISDAYVLSTRGDSQITLNNPDFSVSNIIPPPGWLTIGTGVVGTYDTSTPAPNTLQSLKWTTTSQAGGFQYGTAFSVTPGDTYSLRGLLKSDGTSTPTIAVQFQSCTGTDVNCAFVSNLSISTSSTSWVSQTATATVPAGAVRAIVIVYNNTAAGAGTSEASQISIQKTNFQSITTALVPQGAIATVATATTIAPVSPIVNLTGTTAIATITTPSGISSTIGGCITFIPASTVATTTAGNIVAVYSLVGAKAYQGCWNGTKWYFIGSGI